MPEPDMTFLDRSIRLWERNRASEAELTPQFDEPPIQDAEPPTQRDEPPAQAAEPEAPEFPEPELALELDLPDISEAATEESIEPDVPAPEPAPEFDLPEPEPDVSAPVPDEPDLPEREATEPPQDAAVPPDARVLPEPDDFVPSPPPDRATADRAGFSARAPSHQSSAGLDFTFESGGNPDVAPQVAVVGGAQGGSLDIQHNITVNVEYGATVAAEIAQQVLPAIEDGVRQIEGHARDAIERNNARQDRRHAEL